jgi:inosine-uridine nucleoside N-ribohydrolase
MLKSTLLITLYLAFALIPMQIYGKQIPLLLDCDTANEIDDLYAIVRAFVEPRFEMVGLTSAHYRTQKNAPPNTVQPSQDLNEKLLRLMDRLEVPHPIGANDAMKDSETPQDSPAARFIVEKARLYSPEQKLVVITTGAVTNLASAILLDPAIIPNIRCYTMGLKYENGQLSSKEFNASNDLEAVDCLLKAQNLDWHVMTATASKALIYTKKQTIEQLKDRDGVFKFILDYWINYNPPWKPGIKTDSWIMWDIAAIEAVLHPEFAKEEKVAVPAALKSSNKVWVYTEIDADKMRHDYWESIRRFNKK